MCIYILSIDYISISGKELITLRHPNEPKLVILRPTPQSPLCQHSDQQITHCMTNNDVIRDVVRAIVYKIV